MATAPKGAARTGKFYSAMEELSAMAGAAFAEFEGSDDLDDVLQSLGNIIRRATEIQEAAISAAVILRDL